MPQTICFDLDGVLCKQTKGDYVNAVPNKEIITMLNSLFNQGNHIIIYTSRFMGRNNEDIIKTYKEGYDFTYNQLQKWGVKFHGLFLGKPRYDILIDDRAVFYNNNPEKILRCIEKK